MTQAMTIYSNTRLLEIISEIEGLVDWHADLDADLDDMNPADMHAHCNGLVLKLCEEARDLLASRTISEGAR